MVGGVDVRDYDLAGLRDEGVIELLVSEPAAVAALLTSLGVTHEVRDGAVRTPMMPDDVVGELITRIVSSGTTVYRVQTVRKTLEQAFLELTEPVLAAQPPLASQEMNR